MTYATLPLMISPETWAAALQLDFPEAGIPQLAEFSSWEEWASFISDLEPFATNGCPRPGINEDFGQWAIRFIQVMFV